MTYALECLCADGSFYTQYFATRTEAERARRAVLGLSQIEASTDAFTVIRPVPTQAQVVVAMVIERPAPE